MTRQSPLEDEKYEYNKQIEDFFCSNQTLFFKNNKLYWKLLPNEKDILTYWAINEQLFAEWMGWA